MAELSLAATPEPTNVPPRVRIDVTDTGNSPVISSVTVTDPPGAAQPVAAGRVPHRIVRGGDAGGGAGGATTQYINNITAGPTASEIAREVVAGQRTLEFLHG